MRGIRPAQIRNWRQVSPNEVLRPGDKYRRHGIALRQIQFPDGHLDYWRNWLAERGNPHVISVLTLTPTLCPSDVQCGKDMPGWF